MPTPTTFELTRENFEALFNKMIELPEALLHYDKAKRIGQFKRRIFQQQILPQLKGRIQQKYSFTTQQVPGLMGDVKVDWVGKNERYVLGHVLDFSVASKDRLAYHCYALRDLVEALTPQHPLHFIVHNNTDQIAKSNIGLFDKIEDLAHAASSGIQLCPESEIQTIIDYHHSHNVIPPTNFDALTAS
jgi:hypothetical protein